MDNQQNEPIKPNLSLLNLCLAIMQNADAIPYITRAELEMKLIELRDEIISFYQDVPPVIIDRYVEFVKRGYLSGGEIVTFEEYYDTERYEIE